ncbi:MAG: DUF1508 domain-containing protein [Clostridia bacterium]
MEAIKKFLSGEVITGLPNYILCAVAVVLVVLLIILLVVASKKRSKNNVKTPKHTKRQNVIHGKKKKVEEPKVQIPMPTKEEMANVKATVEKATAKASQEKAVKNSEKEMSATLVTGKKNEEKDDLIPATEETKSVSARKKMPVAIDVDDIEKAKQKAPATKKAPAAKKAPVAKKVAEPKVKEVAPKAEEVAPDTDLNNFATNAETISDTELQSFIYSADKSEAVATSETPVSENLVENEPEVVATVEENNETQTTIEDLNNSSADELATLLNEDIVPKKKAPAKAKAPVKATAAPAKKGAAPAKGNAKAPAKPAKAAVINLTETNENTFGKYVISKDDTNADRPYKFSLLANNGQLLFESEGYKVKPRINSINAFKRNVKTGSFNINEDKQGNFSFTLSTIQGALVGVGESYTAKQTCISSIESVKKFCESATVIEDKTEDIQG